MDIKINRTTTYSIVITENELKALVNFLSSNYSNISITASCSDGSTLITKEIEDIINFENSNFRKIESMKLDFGEHNTQGGDVELNDGLLSTCKFSVNDADDAKALKVAKEIEQRLEECKTWYSIKTFYSFIFWAGYGIVFLWSTMILLTKSISDLETKISTSTSVLLLMIGISSRSQLRLTISIRAFGHRRHKSIYPNV